MSTKIDIEDPKSIVKILLDESLLIADGMHDEIYYDHENKELSFSSQLTQNSYSDDQNKITNLESFDINDLDGFKDIDGDFVEIDDGCNEINEDFDYDEYERYYKDSSIVKTEEALDRILDYISNDGWFNNVIEEIQKRNRLNELDEVYDSCINSNYEEYEFEDGETISLINLRDLALDGGYEDDKESYKQMIRKEILNE